MEWNGREQYMIRYMVTFHFHKFHSLSIPFILHSNFIPSHSTPLHSAPLNSIPFHSIPLHCTPFHSIPLYSTPLHSLFYTMLLNHQIFGNYPFDQYLKNKFNWNHEHIRSLAPKLNLLLIFTFYNFLYVKYQFSPYLAVFSRYLSLCWPSLILILLLIAQILSGQVLSITAGRIVLKFGDMVDMDVKLCKRVSNFGL